MTGTSLREALEHFVGIGRDREAKGNSYPFLSKK